MITKLQKNPASIRFWNKIQFFNSTIFILLYMEKWIKSHRYRTFRCLDISVGSYEMF